MLLRPDLPVQRSRSTTARRTTTAASRSSSTSARATIEGTDVGGLKVAAIADTPKVMTDGNWRLGLFVDEQATRRAGGEARRGLQRAARRPDGRRSRRSSARCSASSARRSRSSTTACATASASATRSTSRSRTSSRSASRPGEPVRFDGMFHPAGVEPHDGRGDALADQRVRDRVRGQDRALDVRVLLGRLSRVIAVAQTASRRAARSRAGVRRRARAARARRAALRPRRRSAGGGRSTRCAGWTTGRGPASGRSAGSSASGS